MNNMQVKTIVIANLIIIAVFLGSMIYPLEPEIHAKEREAVLRWAAPYSSYTLYLDDNSEFTSPLVAHTSLKQHTLSLEPGKYFWKVRSGMIRSTTKSFTLDSEVSITIAGKTLRNDGNVGLNASLSGVSGAVAAEIPYKGELDIGENRSVMVKQK